MIGTVADTCLGTMRTLAQHVRALADDTSDANAAICEELRGVLERTHEILAARRDEIVRLSARTNQRKDQR